jgi:hypothetical protein
MNSDRPCELWHLPIFTVSLSEGGFEKVYQGTTMMNIYRLQLTPQPVRINLTLFAGDLKNYLESAKALSAVSPS